MTNLLATLSIVVVIIGATLYAYGVYAAGVVHRRHTRTDLRCPRCQRANRRAAPSTARPEHEGVITHGCT